MNSLEQYVENWRPGPVVSTDLLGPQAAGNLAATLDLDHVPGTGEVLPALWHWVYFLDWPPTAALGTDGHPRDGHFMPPIPHRRRMFAGGRLEINEPLRLGEAATRHSEVVSTAVKSGKTGELMFVTVRHEFSQGGQLRMTEEQDLVYRSDPGSSTPFTRVTEPLAERTTPWAAEPATHPALLFRFSAVTANSHRIHYDAEYTCGVEGFPALVVHGPLLVLYMAELARAHSTRPIKNFRFRLTKPVFVGDAIRVQGTPAADGAAAELAVVTGSGTVHASAQAEYA